MGLRNAANPKRTQIKPGFACAGTKLANEQDLGRVFQHLKLFTQEPPRRAASEILGLSSTAADPQSRALVYAEGQGTDIRESDFSLETVVPGFEQGLDLPRRGGIAVGLEVEGWDAIRR